jgi:hypothetical protein
LNHYGLNNSGNFEESRVAQNRKTMGKRKFNKPKKQQRKKKPVFYMVDYIFQNGSI